MCWLAAQTTATNKFFFILFFLFHVTYVVSSRSSIARCPTRGSYYVVTVLHSRSPTPSYSTIVPGPSSPPSSTPPLCLYLPCAG
ncbi:hypothetical protein BKA82DRAFT_649684 [Pisolithus tinctorius]|uniref:Secreted protein n=1 Tax=Pisolithus tinctorius Marx 270 TaxID=870435 RepID=A0A0C3NNN7_PISTI|nr:hypothetical protein BKA82DRAFT_649684 [Pisolithus tinctorius]KIO02495.1 hypothetical protein M404DRAFT_649684 [Pisolithus tinctorius Marx 270]